MDEIERPLSSVAPVYIGETPYSQGKKKAKKPSQIEQIMIDERAAYTLVSAREPELKSPSGLQVVKFDTAMLSKKIPFYRESIWDEYLESLAKEGAKSREDSIKADIKAGADRSARLKDELADAQALSQESVQTMINLSILFMLFNPAISEVAVEKRATNLALAKEMTQTVVLFLDSPERMAGLRTSLTARIESKFPDLKPAEKEKLVEKNFLTVRITMAFVALGAYTEVRANGQEWNVDAKRLTTGNYSGAAEGLQALLKEELPKLEKLMGAEGLKTWLDDLSRLTVASSRNAMSLVHSYLQSVVAEVTPPDDRAV